MLDDVRCSLYLNPARGPGFHRLEIIHNERGPRILKNVLVLHGVQDVSAADIYVLTINIEADWRNIWSSGLGRCSDSSERLRFQIGNLFLTEQIVTALARRTS